MTGRQRVLVFGAASLIGLVFGVFATVGCDLLKGKAAEAPKGPTARPPAEVLFVEVQPRTVPIVTEYVAQTYSVDMVEIRARVDGYIEKRLFNSGDLVKAGQVLYALDLRPYAAQVAKAKGDLGEKDAALVYAKEQVDVLQAEAQLAQAEAQLVKARLDVNRLEPLVKEEAAPQQDLDNARQSLEAAQAVWRAQKANLDQKRLSTRTNIAGAEGALAASRAALADAELNLGYATIRSPIAGRVGDTTIQVGGLATKNSSQALTTVVPLDPISVRFKVSEVAYLDFQELSTAAKEKARESWLELILADSVVYPHRGQVKRVLNQVDPRTGTLELQADFPNPQGIVLPGQFGRIRARFRDKPDALLVPQRAVQELQGTRSVYVVGPDNRIQLRSVVASNRVGDLWVIDSGLKAGDRVVVEGLQKVAPGAPVIAKPLPASPPDKAR